MKRVLTLFGAALMCSAQVQPPPKPTVMMPDTKPAAKPAAKPPAKPKPAAAVPAIVPAPAVDVKPAEKAAPRVSSGKDDTLLRAMAAEIGRCQMLKLLGSDTPYYVELSVDDAENFSVSASLGALVREDHSRFRPLRTRVRIGSTVFDNSNSVFSDQLAGVPYDSETLVLDDDAMVLRQQLWLAIDRGYKTAVEAMSRKRAALRGVTVSEPLADFSNAPQVRLLLEQRRAKPDETAWAARVRALSRTLGADPAVQTSSVELDAAQGNFYFVNSEGSLIRIPDHIATMRMRAARQAPDGLPVYDGVGVQAFDLSQFPPDAEMRRLAEEVASNVRALAGAPMGENYVGPVLFEATASAQIFAELFGANLTAPRRPVSDPSQALPFVASELDNRLGSRVLPEWMTVTDDATRKEWKGRGLFGFYQADLEGVAPQPLTLVEKGMLKTFLMTRQPVRGVQGSNGRARLPGAFGVRTARASNLMVEASQSVTPAALRQRLVEMVKQQNKPYGMLIRKMDFPSSGSMEDLRRIGQRFARSGGAARPVSSPILAYRVYPDGREELVRGMRFRNLSARSFRDILAASNEPVLFDYVENGAPFALMGGGSFVVGAAVVAPGVLFEELELEKPEEEFPRLPVAPPPPAGQ